MTAAATAAATAVEAAAATAVETTGFAAVEAAGGCMRLEPTPMHGCSETRPPTR